CPTTRPDASTASRTRRRPPPAGADDGPPAPHHRARSLPGTIGGAIPGIAWNGRASRRPSRGWGPAGRGEPITVVRVAGRRRAGAPPAEARPITKMRVYKRRVPMDAWTTNTVQTADRVTAFLWKVYGWMAVGLGITAIVAFSV